MWLAEDTSTFQGETLKQRADDSRCKSPPLEGGESLCEIYFPSSDQGEKLKVLHNTSVLAEDGPREGLTYTRTNYRDESLLQHEEEFTNSNILSLIGHELLPSNTFTQTFLQSILSSVESRDPVVANAWMETLLDVIDLLPKEIIKKDILTLAVNKGQLSQPVSSRLLCCKMLGKICTKFEPYVIRKEILPVVQSLCQDVDYEVRGCMCRQLDIVARGIGLEATKSAILPELVELANDEESFVRLAGIETVVQMLPLLDDETCTQAIIPLVKKFCENSLRSEDATLPVLSKQLGRLSHGLSANFTSEQRIWFLNCYQELAKLGLPHYKKNIENADFITSAPMPDVVPFVDNQDRFAECRHACAYNFPSMVLFAGPENFEGLYKTFFDLCSDPHYNVRRTIACGFHEVTKLLGLKSYIILQELILLLKDDSLEVIKGLTPHLPESLEAVTTHWKSDSNAKQEELRELVQALVLCEETISLTSSWRLHADFLTRLACLPRCLSPDHIYTTFVPLLFIKIHTARPIPCRTAAIYSLLIFLRNTPKLDHRTGIISQLINELCHGRSCHRRMLYIKTCELVTEIFSKAFFKQYYLKPLLSLAEDTVANVRLRLCSVLPQLKAQMKLPKDEPLLQELESCVRKLMTDEKDRDVAAAVQTAIVELDRIEVSTEPGSRRTSCAEPDIDMEDLKKEEEERQLLELELKERQREEIKNTKQTSTKSLTRQGKIPVRKNAGLQQKRYSCPPDTTDNSKLSSSSLKKDAKTTGSPTNLSGKSSIPLSRRPKTVGTSKVLSSSELSRKIPQPNRCPSPMPFLPSSSSIDSLDRVSSYPSLVYISSFSESCIAKQAMSPQHKQESEEVHSLLINSSAPSSLSKERHNSPSGNKLKKNLLTSLSSPEIPHRSCPSPVLPSSSSRIPTPTSSLRRRSMTGSS